VALRGPGSFTGARVALATALGLRMGGVPRATAVSTLEALALTMPSSATASLALVDALRGEWFVQVFERSAGGIVPRGAPRRLPEGELPSEPATWIGYGATRLVAARGELTAVEPPPLAPAVAVAASTGRWSWDERPLAEPLYLRPPAATVAR
jgi:tRNA A37 threonylcarbamoyladenosine modification protein TsaB